MMLTNLNPVHNENFATLGADSKEVVNYDVCLVFPTSTDPFPTEDGTFEKSFVKFEGKRDDEMVPYGGLDIYNAVVRMFSKKNISLKLSGDKFYLLISIPSAMLKRTADLKEIRLPLNEQSVKEFAERGWPDKNIKPLAMDSSFREEGTDAEVMITNRHPFQGIYGKYEEEDEFAPLYDIPVGRKDPFTDDVRLPLIRRLLDEPAEMGGLEIRIKSKLASQELLAAYPLHDYNSLTELSSQWQNMCILPWSLPFDNIKGYFGAKIALYNVFMAHFWAWLVPAAVIGLPFQILIVAQHHANPSNPVAPFYAVFIVLWGVTMLEFWKQKEVATAFKWGMIDFERSEGFRSEFNEDGTVKLAGEDVMYFDPRKRRLLYACSFSIIFGICAVVIGVVAAIQEARFQMLRNPQVAIYASYIAAVMNVFQITFFSTVYDYVCKALNDFENHATDTQYEDSMIVKNFMFNFVNSYASFFFLAYFATSLPNPDPTNGTVGQCGEKSCLGALAINLAIVLGTQITVGNATEMLTPVIYSCMKSAGDGVQSLSVIEKQYLLDPYDDLVDLVGDYLEVCILFGYMVMFASALPITPFALIFSVWLEIKLDAARLLYLKQRPFPAGAEDIGSFQNVLDLLIGAAVVTNAALIVFTMGVIPDTVNQFTKFWIFIGFQWVIFSTQYVIRAVVPDVPYDIEVQMDRQDYINRKLIMQEPDEDLSMFMAGADDRLSVNPSSHASSFGAPSR